MSATLDVSNSWLADFRSPIVALPVAAAARDVSPATSRAHSQNAVSGFFSASAPSAGALDRHSSSRICFERTMFSSGMNQ